MEENAREASKDVTMVRVLSEIMPGACSEAKTQKTRWPIELHGLTAVDLIGKAGH